MTELVEFLKARLAEDFEVARNAMHEDAAVSPGEWITEHHGSEFHEQPDSCLIAEDRKGVYWTVASEVFIRNAEHMARHDPARVLREIAAKRRIIEDYRIARSALDQTDSRGSLRAGSNAFFVACLALASVYSDHPDFSERWAI